MRLTLMEAITRRRLVSARYNGGVITLAPHLLFERHGDLFVSALNMGKSWREDEEPRLGQFKLAGLTDPQLSAESFDPLPSFDGTAPRPDDTLILAL
ncbi:WYL domain-containing protein [Novosphingobium soli]|uniref:WYL domain-containing protein n=1 Tax=Novosphingobium soli TaxID=574956 RepID=A0ABV6CZ90_9SPHN